MRLDSIPWCPALGRWSLQNDLRKKVLSSSIVIPKQPHFQRSKFKIEVDIDLLEYIWTYLEVGLSFFILRQSKFRQPFSTIRIVQLAGGFKERDGCSSLFGMVHDSPKWPEKKRVSGRILHMSMTVNGTRSSMEKHTGMGNPQKYPRLDFLYVLRGLGLRIRLTKIADLYRKMGLVPQTL